tara:strand:+ start:205 stop:426 length:222 start_codon:yes stop_codon:yes gene_type:complete
MSGIRITAKNEEGVWIDFNVSTTYPSVDQSVELWKVMDGIKKVIKEDLGWTHYGIATGDGEEEIGVIKGEIIG